jgi:hypothetical protein
MWLFVIFNLLLVAGRVSAQGFGTGLNPLPADMTLEKFIGKILEAVVQVGLPVVAVAIVYVGFLFVKARGNEQELITAKKAFLWTVIGASIVLGAFVIQQAIKATVAGLE